MEGKIGDKVKLEFEGILLEDWPGCWAPKVEIQKSSIVTKSENEEIYYVSCASIKKVVPRELKVGDKFRNTSGNVEYETLYLNQDTCFYSWETRSLEELLNSGYGYGKKEVFLNSKFFERIN